MAAKAQDPARRARKVQSLAILASSSGGKKGIREIQEIYPESRIVWVDKVGIAVLWTKSSGTMPTALKHQAGYIETIWNGKVVKDKSGESPLLSEVLFPEYAALVRVMES